MEVLNKDGTKAHRRQLRKDQTDAERLLWSKLRNKQMSGYKFFRQYGIGPYIVDFYCPTLRLTIEADGGQHFEDKSIAYDNKREAYLKTLGIRSIRVTNADVLKNIEGVLERIEEELPRPLFGKEGGNDLSEAKVWSAEGGPPCR